MQLSRENRVLIAWDRGDGPMFGSDGLPVYHHYRVFRDGSEVAMTYAEVFIDDDVLPSRAYRYQVKAYRDAEESSEMDAAWFSVSTTARPPADQVPPTAPSGCRGSIVGGDVVWRWNPSSKLRPDEMLGYLIESSTSGPCRAMVWERTHPTLSWTEIGAAGQERCYRVRGIDHSLNISEPSAAFCVLKYGWTVYTFSSSAEFTLKAGATIDADILIQGGGGAGGEGSEAGGGGAGEMIDLHGVTIEAGVNDGLVVVGEGGDPSIDGASPTNGEHSSFGGVTADGGGFGGTAFEPDGPCIMGASGGSGGGGRAFSAWSPDYADWGAYQHSLLYAHVPGDGCAWDYAAEIVPGAAATLGGEAVDIWQTPYVYPGDEPPEGGTTFWEDEDGDRFWVVARPRGNQGRDGGTDNDLFGGGGGGAHIPWRVVDGVEWPWFTYDQFGNMQSANPFHGGHGRPCDIRGWHMYEETAKQFLFIDWYAAGGAAGARQPGGYTWSAVSPRPGYGGGGAMAQSADVSTGSGGGGGYLYVGEDFHHGGSGARGIVVVRIRTCDEDLVAYPPITGTDPEVTEFGLPLCLTDAEHVEIRRLPEYMTHRDESGDEQCPRTYEEMH